MSKVDVFKENVKSIILDPDGVHHEFSGGMHGQKLDFDLIETNSDLYKQWVDITVETISNKFYLEKFIGVIGVANGTNRLALSVANKLGCLSLLTYKVTDKSVALTWNALSMLNNYDTDGSLIVLEDVGTTGATALSAAISVIGFGYDNIECLTTWQRTRYLELLARANVPYGTIINEQLPIFTPSECVDNGFCSKSWNLIKR